MRTPDRLTTTITTTTPLPTADGSSVVGEVEIASTCTRDGRASTLCRTAGAETWHPVPRGAALLEDPSHLPFHHATTISRLVSGDSIPHGDVRPKQARTRPAGRRAAHARAPETIALPEGLDGARRHGAATAARAG
ncbi:hypothetical protein [Tsukamurella sp. 1534]|uniref:hypothetical protein n=1 Tax=Tsukamurella sp. 1534 TaxID=1151061 RepID=UPI00030CF4BB|nr:hypothetical protein [Tsukamurella sp. 1534]